MSTSISNHTTNTDKADQNNQMNIDLNENINKIKSLIRDAGKCLLLCLCLYIYTTI